MFDLNTIILALIGGLLPAVLWLIFWLEEDITRPEPRRLIFLCFLYGMVAVPLVIPFQKFVSNYFLNGLPIEEVIKTGLVGVIAVLLWAAIEEIFKFGAAYTSVLNNKETDEPIDEVIYMIAAALGFAAAENTFFIIAPLLDGDVSNTIITGNLRFIGATLLHVISSATIGMFMAFSFYKGKFTKFFYTIFGLIAAILLHTGFNFLIIKTTDADIFKTFALVWSAVAILLLLFEKVKSIKKQNYIQNKNI